MVDNFNQINALIDNTSSKEECSEQMDIYYHLQIIKRSKDTGEGANSVCLKAYQVDKAHPLLKYRDDIINLCERFKARAYINLSPKSKKSTAIQMLNNLADCFRKNDFQHINRIWNSAAGQVGAILKYWVIDCDYTKSFGPTELKGVIQFIRSCRPLDREKIVALVPTRNGMHIITYPFDLLQFRQKYPDIDVHKNNPTVLYIPESITAKIL